MACQYTGRPASHRTAPLLMDESTLPLGEPELMRASAFQRYLDELDKLPPLAGTDRSRLASLSPSLLADLERFEHRANGTEALEVLAACLRHAQQVVVHLQAGGVVVPVTVFPHQRLYHCPADPQVYLMQRLALLRVMRVEPAILQPPGHDEPRLIGAYDHYHPIGPLLWMLALHGSRTELLPEIAGSACYRTTPGLDLRSLPVDGVHRAVIRRMRDQPMSVRDIVDISGLRPEAVARLLNALYLQSGLIVSRTSPRVSDSWLAGLGLRRRDW